MHLMQHLQQRLKDGGCAIAEEMYSSGSVLQPYSSYKPGFVRQSEKAVHCTSHGFLAAGCTGMANHPLEVRGGAEGLATHAP